MANVVASLPVPRANGAGEAVDVSTMAARKVVIVKGNLLGVVGIEISHDGKHFARIASVNGSGTVKFRAVARFMRAVVSGYSAGLTNGAVAASERPNDFTPLEVPPDNGDGPAVDVSAFGPVWTVIAVMKGRFGGVLLLEMSQDDEHWETCATFTAGGIRTVEAQANFVRVSRLSYDLHARGGDISVMLGAEQE